jgi:nucleoside-diphosphate-sugar epimerase
MFRVLVTGSSGWIGSHVVAELERRGHQVVPFDLKLGDDIHDRQQLTRKAVGCHAVVHLAAIAHPDVAFGWDDYWLENVAGTQAVAAAWERNGRNPGRFVYASSTAFYGAHVGFPWAIDDLRVGSRNAVDRYYGQQLPRMDDTHRPSLDYAMSKVAAETLLAAYGMGGRMPVSVMRFRPCPVGDRSYAGLRVSPGTCASAVADALDDVDWYVIHDVDDLEAVARFADDDY